jgi:hypothetical protein
VADSHDLDTEAFYRLVLMTRAIAVARPVNLVKYSQPPESSSGIVMFSIIIYLV